MGRLERTHSGYILNELQDWHRVLPATRTWNDANLRQITWVVGILNDAEAACGRHDVVDILGVFSAQDMAREV